METKLDNSKEQTQDTVKPVIKAEQFVAEPIVVGRAKEKEKPADDDDLDLELDLEDEEEESDSESETETESEESTSVADEVEPEEQPKQAVKLTKEQRKIQALKNEAKKLKTEKLELQKQLESKKLAGKEDELAKQYADEGDDDVTARKKAKADIRQSNLEKQVEILLFEKEHRNILAKYPQSDKDLERIISVSKSGVMTVEEICRGLYGNDLSPKDKRAISALVDEDKQDTNNSVAKATRSAVQPTKSKLTPDQLEIKRYLERRFNRKITDEEAIKYSES